MHHTTLYGHVTDRADLAAAAADVLAHGAAWPAPDLEWRLLLTAVGETFWEMFERYPGAAELIRSLPAPPEAAVRRFAALRDALVAQGFAADDALLALDIVADLVIDTAAGLERLDRDAQVRAWAAAAPEIAEAVTARRGWYDRKLAIVLDGLAVRRSAR
ncbi:hypothetical protein BJF78_06620 [Pseudonocardia sp. CNS-139]|nr:hypothetical protein BJF78_06620 [Pseudonocardia sp. CNS-139]